MSRNSNGLPFSLKMYISAVDQVYMDSTDLLKDYVLNDSVTIFLGTKEQLSYKHWYTGQVRLDVSNCDLCVCAYIHMYTHINKERLTCLVN